MDRFILASAFGELQYTTFCCLIIHVRMFHFGDVTAALLLAAWVFENDWSISAKPADSNSTCSSRWLWGGCVLKLLKSSSLLKVLGWGVYDTLSAIIIAEVTCELLSSDLVGSLLFLFASSLTDPWHHGIACHLQKLSATNFKHYPLSFLMLNPQWTQVLFNLMTFHAQNDV